MKAGLRSSTIPWILFSSAALAQAVPADSQLRAAYCIPILKHEAQVATDLAQRGDDWLRSAEKQGLDAERRRTFAQALSQTQQVVRERETALNRMQSYLLPRVATVESAGLTAAANRGQTDLHVIKELPEKCVRECGGVSDVFGCTSRCTTLDADLQTRLEACRKPTWLPAS